MSTMDSPPHPGLRFRVLLGSSLFVLAFLIPTDATRASAESVDPRFWGTSGSVYAMARAGNTLYVGGYFSSVARNSGSGLPIDMRSGEPWTDFARVAGTVYVAVPDGSGGWFIGGDFVAVGGLPRHGLAQIRADGSVSSWSPSVDLALGYMERPTVYALVVDGSRVYLGGWFQMVNGVARSNIAAVDRTSGRLLPWAPEADSWVWALTIHEDRVFVGGAFTMIGGEPRSFIAALQADNGDATDWNPGANDWVASLVVAHGNLYASGFFNRIGEAARSCIAAFDLTTGQLTAWAPDATAPTDDLFSPSPQVRHLVVAGARVYVTGYFDHVGGEAHAGIAALDIETGRALDWDPGFPTPSVESIAVDGRTIFIGGWFTSVGGADRQHLAALDAETAAPLDWDPWLNESVATLCVSGGAIYAGGSFTLAGYRPQRVCLAAFDATTGALRPWDPAPDGGVITALTVHGGSVYVAGGFSRMGGQPRNHLAAVDTLTGAVLPWDPGPNGIPNAIVVNRGTVYVGGAFTSIGGQSRRYIAAVDSATGTVTSWNPNAEYTVRALKVSGGTLYVGGSFYSIGGQSRNRVAALDLASGLATSWNPNVASGFVNTIEAANTVVYIGGGFTTVGAQPREGLAAIDAATGRVSTWNPAPVPWSVVHPQIKSLALCDSLLYVGGDFSAIGGQSRICLAAVDTSTGLATDWDPGTNGMVWSLLGDGNATYAGGGFTRMGGFPCASLATIHSASPAPAGPPGHMLALAPIVPNPASSDATLRFSLGATAPVEIALFDIQGRRVSTVLKSDVVGPGVHEVPIHADGLREGMYYCRVAAGGTTSTGKLLVMR